MNNPSEQKTEIIAFASGKGGTGKTSLLAALGYAFQAAGLRVLFIDADLATDGLSLYLLGPEGTDSVRKNFGTENTLDGYLRAGPGAGVRNWAPKHVSRPDHGGAEWRYTLLMSSLHLYGDETAQSNAPATPADRIEYRKAIQQLFASIRERREWDYVLIDTRGGFASDTVEICAVADSFILVTEPNTTNFYQDRNLFGHITKSATIAQTRPALRGVLVNKAASFPEAEYSALVRRAYELEPEDIFTIPIDPEAISVYQQQQAIYVTAPGSVFATTTLRAFASMFGVVTAPWTQDQITAWQRLAERLSAGAQEKLKRLKREAYRRWIVLATPTLAMILLLIGVWAWGHSRATGLSQQLQKLNQEYRRKADENSELNARLLALAEKSGDAVALSRQLVDAQKTIADLEASLKQRDQSMASLKSEIEKLRSPSASVSPALLDRLPNSVEVGYYPQLPHQERIVKTIEGLGASAIEMKFKDWFVDPKQQGTEINALVYARDALENSDTLLNQVYTLATVLIRNGVPLRTIEAWEFPPFGVGPSRKGLDAVDLITRPRLIQLDGWPEALQAPVLTEAKLLELATESARTREPLQTMAVKVAPVNGKPWQARLFYDKAVNRSQREVLDSFKEFLEARGYQVTVGPSARLPEQSEVRYLREDDVAQAFALARQLALRGVADIRRSLQPSGALRAGIFEVYFTRDTLPQASK